MYTLKTGFKNKGLKNSFQNWFEDEPIFFFNWGRDIVGVWDRLLCAVLKYSNVDDYIKKKMPLPLRSDKIGKYVQIGMITEKTMCLFLLSHWVRAIFAVISIM